MFNFFLMCHPSSKRVIDGLGQGREGEKIRDHRHGGRGESENSFEETGDDDTAGTFSVSHFFCCSTSSSSVSLLFILMLLLLLFMSLTRGRHAIAEETVCHSDESGECRSNFDVFS